MELKISCDASIKLKRLNSIKSIDCNVVDFDVIKDTLSGNIKINGTYIKDDLEKTYEFEEMVPFTVVFRDDNFSVEEIVCGNFSYQEIVNQGIECHFDVFITYRKKDESKPSEEGIQVETQIPDDQLMDKLIQTLPQEVEEVKEIEVVEEENVEPVLKNDEQISKHYDEMLQELLEKRTDNFLEEEIDEEAIVTDENDEHIDSSRNEIAVEMPKKNVEVKIGTSDKKEKVGMISKNLKESYRTVSIYYMQNEADVDKICQKEKLNINDVYDEYNKNRRIIIK